MTTAGEHLGGLPAFLEFLGTSPTGDEVAAQLVHGPGRVFDAGVGIIVSLEDGALRVVGRHGYTSTHRSVRYPLNRDLPVETSVREGAIIVRASRKAEEEFADLAGAWAHTPELLQRDAIVCAPIITRGVSIGGFFLACDSPPRWDSLGYSLLEGVGRGLALWMAKAHASDGGTQAPALTPRQAAILDQLARGRTTAAIAATLGVSASTVKMEMQRIGRAVGAQGRTAMVAQARALGLLAADRSSP